MTETMTAKDPLRHRRYYWAMNAALVWQITRAILLYGLGFNWSESAFWVDATLAIIGLTFGFMLMPLLVALPFWRDEYADMLWKRTVYQIATLFAVFIPIMMFSNIAMHTLMELDDLPTGLRVGVDWYIDGIFADVTVFRSIMGFWGHFTLVFVLFFQFNRWRDSRGSDE